MMTDTDQILRVTDITKSFGGNTILNAVSVKLAKGEIKVKTAAFVGLARKRNGASHQLSQLTADA